MTFGIQPVLGRLYKEIAEQKADGQGLKLQTALPVCMASRQNVQVHKTLALLLLCIQRPHAEMLVVEILMSKTFSLILT